MFVQIEYEIRPNSANLKNHLAPRRPPSTPDRPPSTRFDGLPSDEPPNCRVDGRYALVTWPMTWLVVTWPSDVAAVTRLAKKCNGRNLVTKLSVTVWWCEGASTQIRKVTAPPPLLRYGWDLGPRRSKVASEHGCGRVGRACCASEQDLRVGGRYQSVSVSVSVASRSYSTVR